MTEADWKMWTADDLKPYFEIVLEAFWPERLMFGSDWPVCLVACGYQTWYEILSDFIGSLSKHEKERILGGTAVEVYKLGEEE